jgi:MarR family transcriptional regulator, organic hydroperoxide resistance regulator
MRREATRENVGYLLAKASQRWNELLYEEFVLAGYPEVRPAYGSILLPLFEEDGPRMGDLAARARLAKQTMTTLVRLMERNGLVRRHRDPEDGRAVRVFLTPRARAFERVAERVLARLERRLAGRLSHAERRLLAESLKEVMSL